MSPQQPAESWEKHEVIEVFIKGGRKFICHFCFFSSQSLPRGEEEWAACAGNSQESVFCPFVSLMNKKNIGGLDKGEIKSLEEAGVCLQGCSELRKDLDPLGRHSAEGLMPSHGDRQKESPGWGWG